LKAVGVYSHKAFDETEKQLVPSTSFPFLS
jgi:hypothetical protein